MEEEEEKLEPIFLSDGGVILAHKKKYCNAPCPLHAPSSHHMLTWPLHWRDDMLIFERLCMHGIGHPDPDTLEYIRKTQGEEQAKSLGTHGCDECCLKRPEDN